MFRPDYGPAEVLPALAAVEARLVWADRSMGVLVVRVPPERRWSFSWHGALLGSGSGVPAGCADWSAA